MKKKIIISISVAVLLAIVTVLTCLLATCKKKLPKDDVQANELPKITLNTVHGGTQSKTDDFMVQGGLSDYSIVIPQGSVSLESKAAGIVQKYFLEATGALLNIKKDSENIDFSKVISIGKTKIASEKKIAYNNESESGFIIKTADKSVFLDGGSYGIVYSAYELMTKLFNFDYFGNFDYYIDKNVNNLPFYRFDITEIPDIEYRLNYVAGTARFGTDPMFCDVMRVTDNIIFGGNGTHNSYFYVPWYDEEEDAKANLKDYYTENYREWFSPNWYDYENIPAQLCYSRHADEFYPLALKNAKEEVIKNPKKSILTFINQDDPMWCECETCMEHSKQYGCVSSDYIKFLNRLADDLAAWAKTELNRDIKVLGMAYHASEAAPTVYNEKEDRYEPADQSVKFSDNLYIEYAPHNADYQISFDAKGNEKDIKALRSWSTLSSKLFMWTYTQANYSDYFMFYDNFSSMQRNYQLMTKYKAMYILEQGQWDNEKSTAFNNLRAYLAYKLAWNCQVDYQGLIDKYFDHVFGAAAKDMRELFDLLRGYYMMLHDTEVIDSRFSQYASSKIYPIGIVEFMKGKIDSAYSAIEPLKKTNEGEYNKIKESIMLESMFVRYLDIVLYNGNAATDYELAEMQREFIADCRSLGITKRGESRDLDLLYSEWNLKK